MKTLREIEQKNIAAQQDIALREARLAVGGKFDPGRIDWHDPSLSFRRLREATAESAFPQVLRAGVQTVLFDAYASVGVVYPDLVRVVNSNKYEELYAPLYGVELPKEVKAQQSFEDSRLLGADLRVKNLKFGRILSVERELVDDDLTGQIQQRAGMMGQRLRYVEEQTVMTALQTGTYNTTIGNVNTGGGQLSQPLLEAATIALHNMKDPLGNLMLVQPDTLLVSPADEFNAAKLLGSALQPSVPGAAGQTANTATSGGTGWTMTVNPLQGLFALKVSRFLPSTGGLNATYGYVFLLQARTSLVFQDRDPVSVVPEAANSGESFVRDVYRWRVRRRFNAALLDSRFVYRIN
jgi:hypothetical protein